MKKTKKFEDGGPTGGHWQSDGDGRSWVEDVPDVVAAPVAAGLAPVRGGPMSGGIGAGIAGIQDVSGGRFEDTLAGARSLAMGPLAEKAQYAGLMAPPSRRMGLRGAVPGTYAEGPVGGMAAAMKKGGTVKKMAKGGSTSSASKRGDGCAIKGKTKGRFV